MVNIWAVSYVVTKLITFLIAEIWAAKRGEIDAYHFTFSASISKPPMILRDGAYAHPLTCENQVKFLERIFVTKAPRQAM